MLKFQSPRQKEYEDYLERESPRLTAGLSAFGKKNSVTALSMNPIPLVLLRINPESYVLAECPVGKIHLKGRSPGFPYYVMLIDEGEVGYFYAGNTDAKRPIVDSLQIYNTQELVDKDKTHLIEIVWSEDKLKAALLINRYFHAVFDFEENRGYCRTNFPPSHPRSLFGEYSHEWSDECIQWFIKK